MSIVTHSQAIYPWSSLFFRSLTIANAMRTTAWNLLRLLRALQVEISRGFAFSRNGERHQAA